MGTDSAMRTESWREKQRQAHEGQIPWNAGKKRPPFSEEWKQKLRENNAHYWLGRVKSKEHIRKMSETLKGRKLSKKHITNISKAVKGRHSTPEQIKKRLRRHIPSSLEIKFQEIIEKYCLPYRYVGDDSFRIGRYRPDFISINDKKIAIEVYTKFYKQLNGRDIANWKQKRTRVFKDFGWSVIFFDETQLKESYVLNTMRQANEWAEKEVE